MVYRDLISEALRELSDEEWQEFYWRGGDPNTICEPTELYETLLNGSGILEENGNGRVVFSAEIDQRIIELGERFFNLSERKDYDADLILRDPEIDLIRSEAKEIFILLS